MVRSFDKRMYINTSSAQTISPSYFKPGDTVTFIDGLWSGQLGKRGEDHNNMGRWNYLIIEGRKDVSLLVIRGYRNGNTWARNTGPTTAVAQQDILLRKEGINICTDKAFLQDLNDSLDTMDKAHREILISLDANETFTDSSGIKQFATRRDLYNIASSLFPDAPQTKPSTNRTIDFMLCTKKLLTSIQGFRMAPYVLRLGDHRAMMIEL